MGCGRRPRVLQEPRTGVPPGHCPHSRRPYRRVHRRVGSGEGKRGTSPFLVQSSRASGAACGLAAQPRGKKRCRNSCPPSRTIIVPPALAASTSASTPANRLKCHQPENVAVFVTIEPSSRGCMWFGRAAARPTRDLAARPHSQQCCRSPARTHHPANARTRGVDIGECTGVLAQVNSSG